MAQVRPNGTVPERVALQAFALTYGPLPGVTLPPGARTSIESGGLADSWVLPLLPHLPARVRDAIDQDLGFVHPASAAPAVLPPCTNIQGLTNFGNPHFHASVALTEKAEHWAEIRATNCNLRPTLSEDRRRRSRQP